MASTGVEVAITLVHAGLSKDIMSSPAFALSFIPIT